MMQGLFSRLTGSVNVSDDGKVIRIAGVAGQLISEDIRRLLKTSVVGANMFSHVTNYSVEFPTFFALEMDYLLRTMIESKETKGGRGRYIYSSKATLQLALDELRSKTWLSQIEHGKDVPLNLKNLERIKYPLLPHQRRFLAWYAYAKDRYNLNGMLLTAAAGGGKTINSIAVCETVEVDRVIVVAPANAVENVWAKTLAELMTVDTPHWVSRQRDKVRVPKNCKYFIYHYEDLPVALAMVNRGDIKGNIAIILDESHNFNDPGSQRTQRFELLCKITQSRNIIYSSGTPIKAMGSDTIPLLRVLDPLFTADVEARFRKIYGKNATKANELLANRLAIISYKVPKAEFMIDKPIEHPLVIDIPNADHYTLDAIKVRMVKFINERVAYYKKHNAEYEATYHRCLKIAEALFTDEQRVEYEEYKKIVERFRKYGFDSYSDGPLAKKCNAFEKEAIMSVLESADRKAFKDAKSVYKYVDLKIRGECLGLVLGRERITANVELAKAFNYPSIIDTAKKKTIFFSSHTEVVHEVVRVTKSLGYSPLMVTAETNSMLKSIVQKFGSDKKANPLAATYQSLSTAVPLVMANVIVALNVPFRAHEMEQAISRAYRIGQDEIVQVYYCTINTGDVPNITTRTADIMEWSKEQVNQIMGYSSREDIALDDVVGLEDFHGIENTLIDDAQRYQDDMERNIIDDIPMPEDTIDTLPEDINVGDVDSIAGLE